MKCIRNLFKDNVCYPIAERGGVWNDNHRPRYIEMEELYELRDNILEGFNGTELINNKGLNIVDGNKLYYNDEPEG